MEGGWGGCMEGGVGGGCMEGGWGRGGCMEGALCPTSSTTLPVTRIPTKTETPGKVVLEKSRNVKKHYEIFPVLVMNLDRLFHFKQTFRNPSWAQMPGCKKFHSLSIWKLGPVGKGVHTWIGLGGTSGLNTQYTAELVCVTYMGCCKKSTTVLSVVASRLATLIR